jgi:DNA-binding transcriptional regulator YiaG
LGINRLAASADCRDMSKKQLDSGSLTDGSWITEARGAAGLNSRALARATGIPKRRLVDLERGHAAPTDEERELLVDACGVTREVQQADVDTSAVLHEYVSMVAELRSTTPERFGPVRQEDVAILATAFGDPPEVVKERIARILSNLETDTPGAGASDNGNGNGRTQGAPQS